jgi:hypothetical protein
LSNDKKEAGRAFRFRVSDVVDVPLRGTLLRLRLVDGSPSMKALGVGDRLRLIDTDGVERQVSITGHAVTGGVPTQQRLDRARELDVLVDDAAAVEVEIGWMASGPVT